MSERIQKEACFGPLVVRYDEEAGPEAGARDILSVHLEGPNPDLYEALNVLLSRLGATWADVIAEAPTTREVAP